MNWPETQGGFAQALSDRGGLAPAFVRSSLGGPVGARFNVYRNNVHVGLSEALSDTYPVVRALVGDEFFRGMAQVYIEHNKPVSPVLLNYGGSFAAFIATFEPAGSLPFLADVARVEWAWTRCYHAAEAPSLPVESLQSVPEDRLDDLRFDLHPSVELLQSAWPAVSIWNAHQINDPEARRRALATLSQDGQCAVMVRPVADVQVHLVDPAIRHLLQLFREGASLGKAAEVISDAGQNDLGGMLGFIFSMGAVSTLHTR